MAKMTASGGAGSERVKTIFGRPNENYQGAQAASSNAINSAPGIGTSLISDDNEGKVSFAGLHGKEVTSAMYDEINAGMKRIFESKDGLDEYLDFISSRYHYSMYNTVLLMRQKPGCSFFRTYNQWKEDGYQVRKGARAAQILRPIIVKKNKDNDDTSTKDDSEEEDDDSFVYFKHYGVFSEQDLDESVKAPPHNPISAHFAQQQKIMQEKQVHEPMMQDLEQVCEKMSVDIVYVDRKGSLGKAYGSTRQKPDGKGYIIKLPKGERSMATAATLAHEMGHIMCGHFEGENLRAYSSDDFDKDRGDFEAEAETVSYGILRAYGIETSESPHSYVGMWTRGDETKLKKAMKGVQQGMSTYFSTLEKIVNGASQDEIEKDIAKRTSETYKARRVYKPAKKTTRRRRRVT